MSARERFEKRGEAIGSPKLSEDEKVILKNLDKRWKYIVRNSESLELFTHKPHKFINGTWGFYNGRNDTLDMFNHLFQFIQDKDEEPYLIEDLLNAR